MSTSGPAPGDAPTSGPAPGDAQPLSGRQPPPQPGDSQQPNPQPANGQPATAQPSNDQKADDQKADDQKDAEQEKKDEETQKEEQKRRAEEEKAGGTSNDRLFWALPNFLSVENADNFPPLTTPQKFGVMTRSGFDPIQFAWYAFLAGISQASNGEPGYGQGFQGYAKRFGSNFGDGTVENYMVGAVLASAFHDDPRYFQSGKGGPWRRTGYAISRIVVTRSDAGGHRFNFPEIFGAAAAAAISNTYRPSTDRGIQNTINTWWTQVGYDTLAIVIREFWPDIRRKFSKDE